MKNPAGANEVLRTLTLEDGALDLWLALNDGIADGRDVSWIWDADFEVLAGRVRRATCSGTRAEEMALRLKYAGIDAELVVERDLERSLDAAVAGAAGERRLRAAHLHGAARAARPAVAPRAGEAVVGVSDAVIWHDVENGGYDADLALWRELAAQADGPILDLGAGTGRVALDLAAAGHDVTALDSDARAARRARAARAQERGLDVACLHADARGPAPIGRFALVLAPMQFMQIMGGAAARAERARRQSRPASTRAAPSPRRSPTSTRP